MEIKQVCNKEKCKNYIHFSTKDKIKYNIMMIAVILFTVLMLFLNNLAIEQINNSITIRNNIIEETWREQGRSVLQDLKTQFLSDQKNLDINTLDTQSVQEWAKIRLSGVTVGGSTGTLFLIDLSNNQYVWDDFPGLDKLNETGKVITLADSYKYFYDELGALKTFKNMSQIYSTNAASHNTWNLDGSESLLEWIIIPSDGLGFNNEAPIIDGVKNPNYKAYLLGVSIQKDEILEPYQPVNISDTTVINLLTGFNYAITIGGILIIFVLLYGDIKRVKPK